MKRTIFIAFSVLSIALFMPREVVADGGAVLLAHWQMDEGIGTFLADSSGNAYDGTLISGTWTADRFGEADKAISLDNQRIDIHDDAKAQTVTLSAWINPTRNWVQVNNIFFRILNRPVFGVKVTCYTT